MSALLQWAEPETYGWPPGHMEWLCRCGAEVTVAWTADCSLYDTDDPITAADANVSNWKVGCTNGHVLLLAHELDDTGSDTCPAPTTKQIVERLASPEDVAAWLAWAVEWRAKQRTTARRQPA